MTKFMINNRIDTWKTDVNLLIRHSNKKINSQTFRLDLSARDIFPQITWLEPVGKKSLK